jgi:hypothetical protein
MEAFLYINAAILIMGAVGFLGYKAAGILHILIVYKHLH